MKYFSILFIAILMTSCGGPKPVIDYDREANFSTYSTYNFFPDMTTNLSQLDDKRLFRAVDEVMQQKGFTKSESPQLYINIFTSQYEDVNRNTIGIGVGSGGGNVGVGVSGGIPIGQRRVNFLSMTIDFIDKANDDLIWQAKIDDKFNVNASPENREEFFRKAISKALKQYPPKR